MITTLYVSEEGEAIRFTAQQKRALECANDWAKYMYKATVTEEGAPTFTDAEIAKRLRSYEGFARIMKLPPTRILPKHPYVLRMHYHSELGRNPFGPCVPATSMEATLDIARCSGCDVAQIRSDDMTSEVSRLADERGITLLVV